MDLQLTDRIAVVTGASRGIGLAIASALAEEGARVVAASRTLTPELDALLSDRVVHAQADLLDPDAATEIAAAAVESFGGLDVLINNVGAPSADGPHGSFLDTTDDGWRAMLELNLLTAVRMTRAALPVLLEHGGAVVNVSSINARLPFPMVVDYSAAKAALSTLTKALSEEFAPQGVRVNAVSPGPVRTALWTSEGGMGDAVAAQAGTDRDAALTTVIPQMMGLTTGRMAEPQEIADQVILLASPRSGSTTGAEIVIDSGALKVV